MKKSGCNVWGESNPANLPNAGVCNSEKTFDEAFEICNSVGARLCTKEELVADCTRGTGKFIQIVHSVSLYHHCKLVSYQRLYCFPLLSTFTTCFHFLGCGFDSHFNWSSSPFDSTTA